MLRTNPAYKGLTHPMKPVEEGVQSDVAPRLVPDFKHRYLTEDMPYGLVVFRGVAELVGIPTPTIDTVISWAQTAAGKTYLAAAKPGGHGISETELPASPGEAGTLRLTGESVAESRCPQRYGFFELNWFMKNSGYVTTPSAGKNDDAGWFPDPESQRIERRRDGLRWSRNNHGAPPRRDGREEENDDGVTTRRSTRESAGLT